MAMNSNILELKEYLSQKGLKQTEIAKKLDSTKQRVNNLLAGRAPFGFAEARKWEEAFNISALWLLTGEVVFYDLPKYLSVINSGLKRWAKAAEIDKNISFHTARHTFATMLLTLDVDLYTVSKLLGHKDIKTTQIYAKIIDKKKQDAVNKIPQLF